MLAVVHPTGNEFVRALVQEAFERGSLAWYATSLSVGRRTMGLPASAVRQRPWREAVRLVAQRMGWRRLIRHEEGFASIDAVYQDLARWVAAADWRGVRAIHTYEDGALEVLQRCRREGVVGSYELPIAYWEYSRRLLEEEAVRRPEWEPTLVGTRDSESKLLRKREEFLAADVVVCPSDFVRRTLPDPGKGWVVPFGSPSVAEAEVPKRAGPLRVLFAGSLTQRKGLADLFDAVRMLKTETVQLVLVGAPVVDISFYRTHGVGFEYHPPGAHSEILRIMQSCDVLALPSIIEGRALVQQEALACGLPIIITPHTGGEDLVEEGTGFLVPIRDPAAIAAKIAWFASNRHALPAMRVAAKLKAREYTWDRYASSILRTIHAE